MHVEATITLTRNDGEHAGRLNVSFEVERDDEVGVVFVSAMAGAEIVEMLSRLIVHPCEDDDRPVRLGDARN
jgi:hypothetical protein